jgi:hypothetical protein
MDENDEDVVHAGIVSKSQKNSGIQADFVIRHRPLGDFRRLPEEISASGLELFPINSSCGHMLWRRGLKFQI